MPIAGLISVGVTCSYFILDCAVLWFYAKECETEQGSSGVALMWMHHLVSLVVWPYCAFTSRGAFFVLFFLFTEWSNVLQNVYGLTSAGQFGPRGLLLALGVAWILGFFVNRMIPMPWALHAYRKVLLQGSACDFSLFGRWTGVLTVPVPFVLNTWWFAIMLKEAAASVLGVGTPTHASLNVEPPQRSAPAAQEMM